MKRKEINRCRREWDSLQGFLHVNYDAANWARRWGQALLNEVRRLRKEVKAKETGRREFVKELELERDEVDDLIDAIEKIRDHVSTNPMDTVSTWWLGEQLDAILKPRMEEHHGSEDD